MKTFLQRKILRTKQEAEYQRGKIDSIDKRIEYHHEAIKQLKAEQRKRNDAAALLYSSIGYLVARLSPKEKHSLFED